MRLMVSSSIGSRAPATSLGSTCARRCHLAAERIVVCGVGALGSTCVQYLRNVAAELRLVDFDRVESKNLSAQWFVKQSLGKNKAEAARLQLANFYGVKAEAMGVRLGANNVAQLLSGAALAVDCFDNADSRIVL